MNPKTLIAFMTAALVVAMVPDLAHAAATAGGGGMPYSQGLNTFKSSVTGEVAGIICLVGVVAGVAAYLYQGVLDPLMMKIVQVVIAVCIATDADIPLPFAAASHCGL
jgi:type IV secretory pathway VirB2 component (pilin)